MFKELKAVRFKQANKTFDGRYLTPAENMNNTAKDGEIKPIPVYFDGQRRITIWKCKSIKARLLFLFTGKITIMELGGITPKGIGIGNIFLKKKG